MAKLAPPPEITPPELATRLAADPVFAAVWGDAAASLRRDLSRFVAEAKKSETRERRADQVVEQVQLKAAAAAEAAAQAAAEPSEAAAAL